MTRDKAISAARAGAYAAFVSAGLTVLFAGISMLTGASGGIYALLRDPANLVDVALLVGLGYATMKMSRAAALALGAYWIIASVNLALMTGVMSAAGLPVRLIFLYFFARAVYGTFVFHRIEKATNPDYKPPSRWLYWLGIPAALLFGGFMVLGLAVESGYVPPASTVAGAEVPDRFRRQLVEHGILMPDEPIEYFYSAGVISVLEEGNVLTDRRVVIYWRTETDDVEFYDLYFDEIAEVRVLHNGQGLELSEFQVTGHDPELWMVLQLSPDGAGDKRFLRALRRKLRELDRHERDVEPPGKETVREPRPHRPLLG